MGGWEVTAVGVSARPLPPSPWDDPPTALEAKLAEWACQGDGKRAKVSPPETAAAARRERGAENDKARRVLLLQAAIVAGPGRARAARARAVAAAVAGRGIGRGKEGEQGTCAGCNSTSLLPRARPIGTPPLHSSVLCAESTRDLAPPAQTKPTQKLLRSSYFT